MPEKIDYFAGAKEGPYSPLPGLLQTTSTQPERIHLRCSRLPVFMVCPSSELPCKHPIERDSEAAGTGRGTHAASNDWIDAGAPAEKPDLTVYAEREAGDLSDVEWLFDRAQTIWHKLAPSLPKSFGEYRVEVTFLTWALTGHIDRVSAQEGKVVFLDWKTGRVDRDYIEQLRGYALCLAELSGKDALGLIVSIRHWTDEDMKDGILFRAEHAAAMADRITEKVAQIGKAYAPGEQCAWCRRQHECEALRDREATVLAVVRQGADAELVTKADAESLYQMKKTAYAWAERADEWLRQYVEQNGPVPLKTPDGRDTDLELRIEEITKRPLKAKELWPVMSAWLNDRDIASCVTVNKGALEKIIKAKAIKGKKKEWWQKFMGGAKEAGAIEEKVSRQLVRRKKREPE